jgi:Protein of unknown function (DUF3987)
MKAEEPTFPPFLRAVNSKLKGYCARLALVHALATNPAATVVNLESMENAIKLVAYFETQAWRVMPLIRDNKLIEVERCKAEIRRKLSGCRSMKKRDLQRGSAFPAEVFNQALYELARPGVLIASDGTVSLYDPTNRQVWETKIAVIAEAPACSLKKSIEKITFKRIAMYKANLKAESTYNQVLIGQAKHTFQWSRGTATCSCGHWTLWHSSLGSAKRTHSFHRANMQVAEEFRQGRMGKRPVKKGQRKLVAVDGKGWVYYGQKEKWARLVIIAIYQ